MNTRFRFLPVVLLCAFAGVLLAPLHAETSATKTTPGPDEPFPMTHTFFIEGVKSDADVKAVTDAVLKVKGVMALVALTPSSGFANITFNHHGVTHQQIAQAVADAGGFKASFRFSVPQYAANAEKIDELFAKQKDEVIIECTNREKGEFTLHFLPLKSGDPGPHGTGFNLGKIGHPIADPPPKGFGLKLISVSAGSPVKKAPAAN